MKHVYAMHKKTYLLYTAPFFLNVFFCVSSYACDNQALNINGRPVSLFERVRSERLKQQSGSSYFARTPIWGIDGQNYIDEGTVGTYRNPNVHEYIKLGNYMYQPPSKPNNVGLIVVGTIETKHITFVQHLIAIQGMMQLSGKQSSPNAFSINQ